MKKKNIALCGLLLFPSTTLAVDWKTTATDILQFSAGIITAFALHEAGHALAAHVYGEKIEWHGSGLGSEWECLYPCRNIENVAIAGNLTTAVVGESLLHLPFRGQYINGIQAFNLMNPIAYAVRDYKTADGYGDYRYVDDQLQTAIALHAYSVGYRHFSDRLWGVSIVPGGAQFNFNLKFN